MVGNPPDKEGVLKHADVVNFEEHQVVFAKSRIQQTPPIPILIGEKALLGGIIGDRIHH